MGICQIRMKQADNMSGEKSIASIHWRGKRNDSQIEDDFLTNLIPTSAPSPAALAPLLRYTRQEQAMMASLFLIFRLYR